MSITISLTLSLAQLEAVDLWRETQDGKPSRVEALTMLIDNALRVPEALDAIRQDVEAAYEAVGESPKS